jgi:hypothetical protein
MHTDTQKTSPGRWETLKAIARSIYSDLTDDELRHVQGQYEQLLDLMESKTGEKRDVLHRKFTEESK